MRGPEMPPNSHGGLDMAPKPPALVTPRGTRGALRFCVQAGHRSTAPARRMDAVISEHTPQPFGAPRRGAVAFFCFTQGWVL
jgi:hypothetical protein